MMPEDLLNDLLVLNKTDEENLEIKTFVKTSFRIRSEAKTERS
jgi:hypothetical protein